MYPNTVPENPRTWSTWKFEHRHVSIQDPALYFSDVTRPVCSVELCEGLHTQTHAYDTFYDTFCQEGLLSSVSKISEYLIFFGGTKSLFLLPCVMFYAFLSFIKLRLLNLSLQDSIPIFAQRKLLLSLKMLQGYRRN